MSMTTVMMTPAHALGGISEYELDGFDYYVEWSEDEWGEGLAFFHCEYCSAGYEREFSDGDHEGCAADMIPSFFERMNLSNESVSYFTMPPNDITISAE